jgi:protease I
VVDGRTLTSWPSLRIDLANAGATGVNEEAHVDGTLVTSRKPDDLPAVYLRADLLSGELLGGGHLHR